MTQSRTETARDPSSTLATALSVLVLCAIGGVLPVLLARKYGALDIPRSDAWSYLHTLFEWRRTGHWNFNNWVSMTLVGQVFAAVPIIAVFGYSVQAVNIAFACAGVAGLLFLRWLARLAGLSPLESSLVAVVTAASPIWGPLAPTFMTDLPAFTVEMLALALACVSLRRPRPSVPLLAASIAVGFFGVSIRQYGAVPLIAIIVAAFWRFSTTHDRRRLRALVVVAIVTTGATIILFSWWRRVPNGKGLTPTVPTSSTLKAAFLNGGGFLRLTGIMTLPVVLLARPLEIMRRAWRTDRGVASITAGIAAFWMLIGYVPNRPFVGNYLARRGVLDDNIIMPGIRPKIMPDLAFDTIVVIATLSALVLVLAMVPWMVERRADLRARRLPDVDPVQAILAMTVAGFALAYELAMAIGLPIFDRYALPALPLVAVLLLRSVEHRSEPADVRAAPSRGVLVTSALGLVFVATLGIVYTAESASFDGTRWKVAQMAVDAGYSHVQIDAGYEWVGWFRGDGPLTAGTIGARKDLRAGYYRGLCVSILIDAHDIPPHAIASAWSHALTRRPALFVAFRNDRACSAAPDTDRP